VLLPAAALAAAILGFVLVAVGHHDNGPSTVVLQNAVDASVAKGGVSTPARTGAKLADGTVIEIGPSGTVTVNGTTLGPGARAIIRNGRLQRLREALQQSTSTTVAPGANAAPAWEQLPIAVDLEARRTGNGVAFTWTPYSGSGAVGYVLVREDRTIVAERRIGGVLRVAYRAAPTTRTRYVLVIFGAGKRPIARSEVVAV
jgi:hypothetical protein